MSWSVVIVDDTDVLRASVRQFLMSHPRGLFEVVGQARDGTEAVEVVTRAQPDLVLLDLSMPGMGGVEALPLLRAACPTAKVVVFSALTRPETEAQVVGLGAAAFVRKGAPLPLLAGECERVLTAPPALVSTDAGGD